MIIIHSTIEVVNNNKDFQEVKPRDKPRLRHCYHDPVVFQG
jgi:hypothetical protein